jgi:hypothetical protein
MYFMSNKPNITALWLISESSPSGLIKAITDVSHLKGSQKDRALHYQGKPVGHKFNNGRDRYYWRVRTKVAGKEIQEMAHRVIWMIANGPIPEGMTVDHIDNDGLNNSLSNLRLATASEQARNRKVHATSKLGIKGAKLTGSGKYESRICIANKSFHLGTFDTAEEAHKTYCDKAKELHGLFHRSK